MTPAQMSNNKVSSILVGVAGEYFAAAELSRRGYIASITLRNTKGIADAKRELGTISDIRDTFIGFQEYLYED